MKSLDRAAVGLSLCERDFFEEDNKVRVPFLRARENSFVIGNEGLCELVSTVLRAVRRFLS